MTGIRKTTTNTQPSSPFKLWTMTTSAQSSKTKWLMCIFLFASYSDWMCQNDRPPLYCRALSTSTTATFAYPTTTLTSVGKPQLAVLDGAEWNSVQSILREQQRINSHSLSSSSSSYSTNPHPTTKYGYMNVVTGRDENNRRVVAMQCMHIDGSSPQQVSSSVYEDSKAVIPNKVSDEDAISTYIASMSVIHCALPRLENIGGGGGDSSASFSRGKAVVLGSGDLACFSAEGLASLGMEVYLVNNKGNGNVRNNIGKLQVIKAAVGDSEVGFASYLGEFDCLVDTIGNERTHSADDYEDDSILSLGKSTLQMLKSQHKCYNYISTLTNSQNIVASDGLFGGPRKADGYSEKVGNTSFLTRSRECQSIHPPRNIGGTLETLMKNGVILTEKQRKKSCSKKSDAIRGWSLSDFWEQMSWPRDSSGSGTTRFGLPVRDDSDDVEKEFMISEAPYDAIQRNRQVRLDDDVDIDEVASSSAPSSSPRRNNRAIQKNPYVLDIMDMDGLQSEIVVPQKNCILFMSARFCKTCKTINPAYTRMARMSSENDHAGDFTFVKAETSGATGKKLAAHLSVRAVPSFVFVREGKILGQTYVSKLPSKKVEKAVQILTSGAEWDHSLLDDDK